MTEERLDRVGMPTRVDFGRFGQYFAVGMFALAYALVIPLKLHNLLLLTVSWVGVALVPATWFLGLAAVIILPVQTTRQRQIMAACSLGCVSVGTAFVHGQGWV